MTGRHWKKTTGWETGREGRFLRLGRAAEVGFRPDPVRALLPAALFLTGAAAVFLLAFPLFCGEHGRLSFDGFFWWFWGLAVFGALLSLTELRLPETARRVAGWILLLLAPLGAFYGVDLINGTRILKFPRIRCLANYLCYLMGFLLLYALFRRVWAAVLAGGSAFLLFGIVNHFVVQFRGLPILPWDLSAAFTAVEVSGGYKFTATRPMILSLLGLAVTVCLCGKLAPTGKSARLSHSRRSKIVERAVAAALGGLLAFLIFPCDLLSSMQVTVWAWNQKTSAEVTGVAAGFCANVQFLLVDKPEEYSREAVDALGVRLQELEEPAPLGEPGERLPSVIVVMNESLADLMAAGELESVPDALPFLHSLQQSGEVIWGTAYASAFGGNTCNTEYEFLTGNTMAFLPAGSKPYQQYVNREQTGLPSIFQSYGYECTAIHPGTKTAWQRNTAYPHLGFDEFIGTRDFTVAKEAVHGLVSDRSSYHQVLQRYLQGWQRGTPQFIFNVTIQNHGGYTDKRVETTVRIKDHEGQWPKGEQYLSLIRESDLALQELIEFFRQREDPVVVLFFGDHWPNLEAELFSALLNADANDLAFEDLMRQYQVPFVIWANYPLQAGHMESVSVNYLPGLLLRAAGLEGTDYTRFLEDLRQTLPVITGVGTMDARGELYKNGEETPYDQLLSDYAVLQYNNAFGDEEKARSLFTR